MSINEPSTEMPELISVRDANQHDVGELIELMRGLAQFEGYLERFVVTPNDLLERGFDVSREPQFHVIVAEKAGRLIGYALTYLVPFTFDLRPTLVLKEFFVSPQERGAGIGHHLFRAVLERGQRVNARLLRWQVLPSNAAAAKFYRSFGGEIDGDWDNWVLELRS
jgi:GNAT superfamily N-acetyltransferase